MTTLDDALLQAHHAGNGRALVELYETAADQAATAESAAFYLTHAYVFALETDHPNAPALRHRLEQAGREEPLLPPRPVQR